jgi:hypothetical protein
MNFITDSTQPDEKEHEKQAIHSYATFNSKLYLPQLQLAL